VGEEQPAVKKKPKDMSLREISLEDLQKRCKENPKELGNVLDLLHRYSALDRLDDALALCRSMMKAHSRTYSFLLEFANVLYKRGDLREARMIFGRLTELKPERVEAWNNLGILELSAGAIEAANTAFRRVLEIEPNNLGALCNTGNYFAERGDAGVAATYFERAIEAKPDFTEAWYNLGNSYMSLSQFSEAKRAFEKAIRYDKLFGSAYKNLGFVCEQLDDDARALECYTTAASLNRTDAGIQANMAGIYMRAGQYGKALECGRRAAMLAPSESSSWHALRGAAIQLGDGQAYYRAITALIKSISDDDLACGISDLREMGFAREAEELVEYSVKINRADTTAADSQSFVESKAPELDGDEVAKQKNKIIVDRKTAIRMDVVP